MKKQDTFGAPIDERLRRARTRREQEALLGQNELLRRFARSRETLDADPWRPAYHFTSPENRMNDPNGLCFRDGLWHLFYQGYPPENDVAHWGHAVSEDLVRWRDLPYALHPGPEKQCYSGTTLVEKGRVIAMYHGKGLGNMVAVARDPLLLDWRKLTGTAVIPDHSRAQEPAFDNIFDPCLWRKGGLYYSLSGHGPRGTRRGRRKSVLFRSRDLVSWECLHEFIENDYCTDDGDDAGCPYFLPLGDRHILLFFSHLGGGRYFLGDYDTGRDKFRVTRGGRFNFGAVRPSGVHAPSACPDGHGGLVAIFNMNPGFKTPGWDQLMTLPRRITLDPATKNDLLIEPAGDIPSLRRSHARLAGLSLPANREVVLPGIAGRTLEIRAEISPGPAPALEMGVLRSPGAEEVTRILFFRDRGYRTAGGHESLVTLDSAAASLLPGVSPRAPETAPVEIPPGEPLRLRVFLDRSVVEVFVNGRQCLALRVYPSREDSTGVSLLSRGIDGRVETLEAWEMESARAAVIP